MGIGGGAMAKRASDSLQFWAALNNNNNISSGHIAPAAGRVLVLYEGQAIGAVGMTGDVADNHKPVRSPEFKNGFRRRLVRQRSENSEVGIPVEATTTERTLPHAKEIYYVACIRPNKRRVSTKAVAPTQKVASTTVIEVFFFEA